MERVMILMAACFVALPVSPASAAPPRAVKSGTLEMSCVGLDPIELCFSGQEPADLMLRVAGKETGILSYGPEPGLPYEIEGRQGAYRVKVGSRLRSDIPFFAYREVTFRRVGQSYRVERYTIATDFGCEGSPDIRMIYEFDLFKRRMTAVLAPPWSSDNKVHRFVRPAKLADNDLFRLSSSDFTDRIGRPIPEIQGLCSA